ncbi:hypothetical protein N656DRAFT_702678 [Canariomyces notabilis]|uniref:Mitochondrial inner membrane protein COX18 n=1 Tax=Canariomyces notabilis TaxID=2074819 RepID=A0AAN6YVE0_9PEZI|nr:hypothetical protein N656DRAFT_702678 [Canariomyces arenarius]
MRGPKGTSSAFSSISRRTFLTLATPNPHVTPFPSSRTRSSPKHRPTLPLSNHHQTRSFSLIPILETAITASQTLLSTLHTATCTPWYLTIPLFALVITLPSRLPTTVLARAVAVRRAKLAPLMRAWAARVNHELAKIRLQQQQQQNEMMSTNDIAVWGLKYRAANLAEKKRRFRRWGVQSWKDWVPSLVVFPLWITGIEGLRRMCGGPRGLLGRMVFGNGEAPEGRDEAGVTGAAVQGMGGGEGEIGEALVGSLSGLDPSLATGGCLWFPDLTAADPYHVLPFALSAVLLLNLLRTAHTGMGIRSLFNLAEKNQIVLVQNKWRLRVQRALLMVAVAVGPMTMDLPAALHLYWICSAALTGVQTEIIARLMPMPKTVTPAKRTQAVELVRPTREGTKKP